MKEILKQPTRLSLRHRESKSKEEQQLLRQVAKLFIGDGDVLNHKKRNNSKSSYHIL